MFGEPELGRATIPIHRNLAEAIVGKDQEEAVSIMAEIMDHLEADVRLIMKGQRHG